MEETYANKGKTCKRHTESPLSLNLSDSEAEKLTTEPLCCLMLSAHSSLFCLSIKYTARDLVKFTTKGIKRKNSTGFTWMEISMKKPQSGPNIFALEINVIVYSPDKTIMK